MTPPLPYNPDDMKRRSRLMAAIALHEFQVAMRTDDEDMMAH